MGGPTSPTTPISISFYMQYKHQCTECKVAVVSTACCNRVSDKQDKHRDLQLHCSRGWDVLNGFRTDECCPGRSVEHQVQTNLVRNWHKPLSARHLLPISQCLLFAQCQHIGYLTYILFINTHTSHAWAHNTHARVLFRQAFTSATT